MKQQSVRARSVSRRLTLSDAVEIWSRRAVGEAQHVLAAAYGVNPGRISEVCQAHVSPKLK